ncbi:hypothetical protein H6F86_20525 [Phormidium sp. FACHB-592]|uniref:Inorganic pyrophosphatase domain-containing protein n=1 Tax=Stenomitos frigidus AS-A4 TaxID=2933935 RepID=A0ABV0KEF3_9CYAN|nr:hypothetical protein [Phormidium sp. FACHB-592]MBD2076218.1 hypothetical protein [Phormidium sp. FACHB-592]
MINHKKFGDTDSSFWSITPSEPKADAFPKYDRRVLIHGCTIGITHPVGSHRFPNGKPLIAAYGHLLGTSDRSRHSSSADIYLGNEPESTQLWKVTQTKPDGLFDEYKYFAHVKDAAQARALHRYHVGGDRSGQVEPADWSELKTNR